MLFFYGFLVLDEIYGITFFFKKKYVIGGVPYGI